MSGDLLHVPIHISTLLHKVTSQRQAHHGCFTCHNGTTPASRTTRPTFKTNRRGMRKKTGPVPMRTSKQNPGGLGASGDRGDAHAKGAPAILLGLWGKNKTERDHHRRRVCCPVTKNQAKTTRESGKVVSIKTVFLQCHLRVVQLINSRKKKPVFLPKIIQEM